MFTRSKLMALAVLFLTLWVVGGGTTWAGEAHGDCVMCHPDPSNPRDLGEVSPTYLCLNCHDGTLGRPIRGMETTPAFRNLPGEEDHPVEIRMLPQHGFRSASEITSLPLGPGGTVTCITCHDPHNRQHLPGMLRMSNAGSALCLTCHIV